MGRATIRNALACGLIAAVAAAGAAAQGQQVYRYVDKDGGIVYSDRMPPSDSKDVQAKRLRANIIENSELPLAAQQAQERFPVKLYTFSCGQVCAAGEALLNRRGVPFTAVNVETRDGADQLAKVTGELKAPVLQVGDKIFVKGYSETQWQAALDDAGYPKAPAPRRAPAGRAPSEPTAAATATAATPGAAPQAVNAPAGYPKE
jgi:glutaredoxin